MLSLAIVDDIGAILVVAIGYTESINGGALAVGAFSGVIVRVTAMLGVRNVSIYFLLGGLMWLAFDSSGIHATVTGVVLGLMTPARRWVNDERLYAILERVVAYPAGQQRVGSGDTKDRDTLLMAQTAAREVLSPVERLEILLHPWVGFAVMPLFALANAGVPISFGDVVSPVALAVFVGFVSANRWAYWPSAGSQCARVLRYALLISAGSCWPAVPF